MARDLALLGIMSVHQTLPYHSELNSEDWVKAVELYADQITTFGVSARPVMGSGDDATNE
jgi:hypothetical protein